MDETLKRVIEAQTQNITDLSTVMMEKIVPVMEKVVPVVAENNTIECQTPLLMSLGNGEEKKDKQKVTRDEPRMMGEIQGSGPFDIRDAQARKGGGAKNNNRAELEPASCASSHGPSSRTQCSSSSCPPSETKTETPCGVRPSDAQTPPETSMSADTGEKKEKTKLPAEVGGSGAAVQTTKNKGEEEEEKPALTQEEALARMKAAGMDVGFSPLPIFYGAALLKEWHSAAHERRKKSQAEEEQEQEEEEEATIQLFSKRPLMNAQGSGLVAEDLCNPSTQTYITPEITPKTHDEWMALYREAFDDIPCTDPAKASDAFGRRVGVEKAFMSKDETETVVIPWYRDPNGEDVQSYAMFRYANAAYAIAQRVVITDEVNEIDKRNAEEQERHDHFRLMHVCARDVEAATTVAQCAELATRLEKHVVAFETAKKHDKQADMYKLLRQCKDKKEALEKNSSKEEEKERADKPETLVNGETTTTTTASSGLSVAEQFDRSLKSKVKKKKKKKGEEEEIKRCTHAIWKAVFRIPDDRNLPLGEVFPLVSHMLRSKMKVDMQHVPAVETRDVTPPREPEKKEEEEEGPIEGSTIYRIIHQFDRLPEEKVVGHLLTTNAESKISPWRATGIKVVLPAFYGGTEQELVVANHEHVRIFDMPFCKEKKHETYHIVPEAVVKAKKRPTDPSRTLFKPVHPCISDAYVLLFGYFLETDVPALLCIDRRAKILTVFLSDVPMSCVVLSSTQPDTALVGLHNGVVLRVPLVGGGGGEGKKNKGLLLRQEVLLYPLSDKTLPEHYHAESEYYAQFCSAKCVTLVPPYTNPERRGTRNTFFAGNVAPVRRIVERALRVISLTDEGLDLYRMMDEWKDENVVTLAKRNVATFAFVGNLLIALMHDNSVGMVDLVRCVMDRIDGPPIVLKPPPPPTADNVEAIAMHETSIVVFHKDTTRRIISLVRPANVGINCKPKTEEERARSFLEPAKNKNKKKSTRKNKKGKK